MTIEAAALLAQKRDLPDRFEQNPGPNERAELERLLTKIDAALNLLDEGGLTDPSQ